MVDEEEKAECVCVCVCIWTTRYVEFIAREWFIMEMYWAFKTSAVFSQIDVNSEQFLFQKPLRINCRHKLRKLSLSSLLEAHKRFTHDPIR